MPSFQYGARQFDLHITFQAASTAANVPGDAWHYKPAMNPTLPYGTLDFAQEQIKQATLIFPTSIASVASTAAGGSVILAATQYNYSGATQNSATFYNQAAASQASGAVDVSTKMNWNLNPGDYIIFWCNSNTVAVPAAFPTVILSGTIDTVTST
jgi:hypothetical protein